MKRLPVLIIILVTVLVYSNIFQNDFVSDDYTFIFDWEKIKDFRNLPDLLKGSLPEGHDHVYRPLRSVFYLISYYIWGLNSLGYHFQAILIHLIATVLVYYITLNLNQKRAVAFIAALVFGVHPVHTESVTWITSSFDVFSLVFFLAAFFLYLKAQVSAYHEKFYYFTSIAFTFLAVFSYEVSLIFPLMVLLYDICLQKYKLKQILQKSKIYIIYLLVPLSYLFIRFYVLGIFKNLAYLSDSFYFSQLATLKAITKYISLLLFPNNLSFITTLSGDLVVLPISKKVPLSSLLNLETIFHVLLVATLILVAVFLYRRIAIISFCLGWFFISLIPISNLVPSAIIMAERYLYLPSVGYAILFGVFTYEVFYFLKNKFGSYSVLTFVFVIITVTFYSVQTYLRNQVWRDSFTLWTETLKKSPKSVVAHNNLARIYEDKGDMDSAITEYKKAVEVDPNEITPLNNLAGSYFVLKQYDLAEELLNRALKLAPKSYKLRYNLGLVLERQNKTDLAMEQYQEVLKIKPDYAPAQKSLENLSPKDSSLK